MPGMWRNSLVAAGVLAVPLGILSVAALAFLGAADQRVFLSFLVTISLALSIQVFSGPTGIMSFGHVAFMGVGAYVAALLMVPPSIKAGIAPALPGFLADLELGLPAAIPIAFLAGIAVSGVVGLVMTRMEETAMSMATVSLLLIFGVLFSGLGTITGGAQGIYAIPDSTTILTALAVAVVFVFIGQAFSRSRAGVQLRASRSSPLAAESLGVRLIRLRWVAWTLAGGLIAAAGAVWAGYSLAFSPGAFGFDLTFSLLAAIVVGGLYSILGTVLGAALLTVMFEVVRRVEAVLDLTGLTQIAVAVLILLILYRFPEGIAGSRDLPEVIRRRKLEVPE